MMPFEKGFLFFLYQYEKMVVQNILKRLILKKAFAESLKATYGIEFDQVPQDSMLMEAIKKQFKDREMFPQDSKLMSDA